MAASEFDRIDVDLEYDGFEVAADRSQSDAWSLGCDISIEDIDATIQEISVNDIVLSGSIVKQEISVDIDSDMTNVMDLDVNVVVNGVSSSLVESQIVPYENILKITSLSPEAARETGYASSAYAAKLIYDLISAINLRVGKLESTNEQGGVINSEIEKRLKHLEDNQFFERYDDSTVKTKYNLFSDYEISAHGLNIGSGGSGVSYLKDLWDVTIVSAANDDILVYNGTHWVNMPQSSIVPDLSVLENYLLKTEAAELYLLKDAANSLATKDSVQNVSNALVKLSEEHGNRLNVLEKLLDWFHLTEDGESVYTEKNFFSTKEISAKGLNAGSEGGSGLISIENIIGVSLSNPVTGDVFVYNGTHWTNISQSELVPDLSGYATTDSVSTVSNRVKSLEDRLNDLESEKFFFKLEGADDVIYTPYNLFSEKEISAHGLNYGSGSGASGLLTDLLDVKAEDSTSGDLLVFDGTHWINTPQSAIVPSIDTSVIATREWVGQNYASTSDLSNGVKEAKAYTDVLRTHVNEQDQILSNQIAEILDWFTLTDGVLLTKYNLASEKEVSAKGINASQGGGSSYNRLDSWSAYDSSKAGYVLSALLGYDLHSRVTTLENAEVDLSDYYTKSQTDSQIASAIGAIDLSPYATKEALSTLEGQHNTLRSEFDALNNLLSSDTTDYINTWNEVVAFLDGYKDESDLATILSGMNGDIASRLLASEFESWKTTVFDGIADRVSQAENDIDTNAEHIVKAEGNITALQNLTSTHTTQIANHITRLDGLDQSILSINTRIDGVNKTIEDHIAEFIAFRANFEISDDLILVRKNFASTEEVSAKGINQGTGGGGGSSYSRLDTWEGYDNNKAGYVLSAGLGYGLKVAIDELEGYNLDSRVSAIENSYISKDAGGVINGGLTVSSLAIAGGTSSQFLKADGSLDGTSYLPLTGGTIDGHLTIGYEGSTTAQHFFRMYRIINGTQNRLLAGILDDEAIELSYYNKDKYYYSRLVLGDNRYQVGGFTMYDIIHSGNIGEYALFERHAQVLTSKDNLDDYTSGYYGWQNADTPINGIGFNTAMLAMRGAREYFDSFQLVFDYNGEQMYYRCRFDETNWKPWKTIAFIDSTVANSTQLDGLSSTYYAKNILEEVIDLNDIRSGLRGGKLYAASNAMSASASYRGFLEFVHGGYGGQLNQDQYGLYYRYCEASAWSDWKTIAFTDSNVASAQALVLSNGTVGATVSEAGNLCIHRKISSADDSLNLFEYSAGFLYLGYSMRNEYTTRVYGNKIEFLTGDTPKMLINASGNVTIGGSDLAGADYKLYVAGSAIIESYNSGFGALGTIIDKGFVVGTPSYGVQIWTRDVDGNTFIQSQRFDTEPTAYDIIFQHLGGKVGIGITNPQYKLHVDGSLSAGATTLSSLTVSSYVEAKSFSSNTTDTHTENGVARPWYGLSVEDAYNNGVWLSGYTNIYLKTATTMLTLNQSLFSVDCTSYLGGDTTVSGALTAIGGLTVNSNATIGGNLNATYLISLGASLGYVELSHATPYIDFHYGNETNDYTLRLIEGARGRLDIVGSLSVSGLSTFTGGISSTSITIGGATLSWENGALKVNTSFYSEKEISAKGLSTGGGSGASYNRLDAWGDYDSSKAGYVLSAYLGDDLNTRLSSLSGVVDTHTSRLSSLENAGYITSSALSGYLPTSGGKIAVNSGIQWGDTNNVIYATASTMHIDTDSNLFINGNQVIHSGNIGSQSVASATNAGGIQGSTSSINFARGHNRLEMINDYSGSIGDFATAYQSGISVITEYVGWQMTSYGGGIENPYFRSLEDTGIWKPWRKLAFIDDNVDSAQALKHSNGTVGATVADNGGLTVNGILTVGGASIHPTANNPYFQLYQNSKYWYWQADDNYAYIGGTSSKAIRIDQSGNVLVIGTLRADGQITANNGLSVSKGLSATDGIVADWITAGTITANTSASIAALTVSGLSTLTGGIATNDIHGNGQSLYLGNASNNAYIKVREDMSGVDGTWSIPRNGNVVFNTLTVNGASLFRASVAMEAAVVLDSTLTVSGASTLASLTVTNGATVGSLTSNGNVSGLNIYASSNLSADGTLTIGSTSSFGGIVTVGGASIHPTVGNPYFQLYNNNKYWYWQSENDYMYIGGTVSKAMRLDQDGNTKIVGTLSAGATTLSSLSVNGATTLSSLNAGATTLSSLGVNGALTIGGTTTANTIKIKAGQSIQFEDSDGSVHTLQYDSTKQAFVFDGNVNATGEMSAKTLNA